MCLPVFHCLCFGRTRVSARMKFPRIGWAHTPVRPYIRGELSDALPPLSHFVTAPLGQWSS